MNKISLSDIDIEQFFSVIDSYIECTNKEIDCFKYELEEIFNNTRYEKLGNTINQILTLYNNNLGNNLYYEIISIWKDSETSLFTLVDSLSGGDEANYIVKKIENKIYDNFKYKLKNYELIDLKQADTPSIGKTDFENVKKIFNVFAKNIENTRCDFIELLERICEENQALMCILPIFNLISTLLINMTKESKKIIDGLEGEYLVKLNKIVSNNSDTVVKQRFESNVFGVYKKTNALSTNKTKNIKKYGRLKEFSTKFYEEECNYDVFKDFTKYILLVIENSILEDKSKYKLNVDTISKLMCIYEDYFKMIESKYWIHKDEKNWIEHVNIVGVHIIHNENKNLYESDEDRNRFTSNCYNLESYDVVARMIKVACKDNILDYKMYRIFYVILDVIENSVPKKEFIEDYREFSINSSIKLSNIIGEKSHFVTYNNKKNINSKEIEEEVEKYKKQLNDVDIDVKNLMSKIIDAIIKQQENMTDDEKVDIYNKDHIKHNEYISKYKVEETLVKGVASYIYSFNKSKQKIYSEIQDKVDKKDKFQENFKTIFESTNTILEDLGLLNAVKIVKPIIAVKQISEIPIIKKRLDKNTMKFIIKYSNIQNQYAIDCYMRKFNDVYKIEGLKYLNNIIKNINNEDIIDKLENAYIVAYHFLLHKFKFIGKEEYKDKFKEKRNGAFVKLFKAGLLYQGIKEVDCDKLINIFIESTNIDPDLNVNINPNLNVNNCIKV